MSNNCKKYIILFIVSLCLTQTWEPFHPQEYQIHFHENFDYEEADRRALDNSSLAARDSLTHRIIGYLPYWEYSDYPDFNFGLLTEINFFSAELNQYGTVVNSHNWENLNIVNYAHDRGVKVKLCATLFNSSHLESLLSSSANRANAINNLLDLVVQKNADGIDIDFEGVPSSQRFNLVLFMIELSEAFHAVIDNPIITMATPAIDWSDAWDYNALAQLTDGLFIMGYNYFYSGSSSAGPVSPLGGYFYDLEYTVDDYIDKTNGNVEKLILGLPYYGYDWPVSSSDMNSLTTANGSSITYSGAQNLSSMYGYNYNDGSQSPWFAYNQGNTWHQCWYDDQYSLSAKYEYAKDMNLGGVGIWALGYDTGYVNLWDALSNSFSYTLSGDVNGDSIVNVIDIVVIINIILDNDSYSDSADLNNDNEVSVLDIIILVNMILDS